MVLKSPSQEILIKTGFWTMKHLRARQIKTSNCCVATLPWPMVAGTLEGPRRKGKACTAGGTPSSWHWAWLGARSRTNQPCPQEARLLPVRNFSVHSTCYSFFCLPPKLLMVQDSNLICFTKSSFAWFCYPSLLSEFT